MRSPTIARCPDCEGFGFNERITGSYRGGNGVYEPEVVEEECERCDGSGQIEGEA
jgi:DnaJ-class molecular chaperone